MTKVPFLLVGDGPTEPTGLGRIAREIAMLLTTEPSLSLDVVQVGGQVPPPSPYPWRHYPLDRGEDWGASCVARYWGDLFGRRPGVLFVVWDPGRLVDYAGLEIPAQKWCYTAVDSTNRNGEIVGPAGYALRTFDRVLAYGRWASERLKSSLQRPIPYLPHGIAAEEVWGGPQTIEESDWVDATLGPHYASKALLLGCVATNQPRKDLSIFFGTLAELRSRGLNVYGWLHTDILVKAWSVAQLVEDFKLDRKVTVTLENFSDRQLASLYQRCDLTIAPGLGEGFGYPIVESLAAGTPVLHGDFGGGAELLPKTEWRVPLRMTRLEGTYALERPVFSLADWANAAERMLRWRESVGRSVCQAYTRGSVASLQWSSLWPRWRSWIRSGLEGTAG